MQLMRITMVTLGLTLSSLAMAGGDAAKGKAVYTAYCAACHQADGTGMNGALAADLVKDKTRLAKSDAALTKSIKNGMPGTAMIAWAGTLSDADVANVLAYVRKTFGSK
jgi:cytochrome c oxidase subunit 2